MFYQISSLVTSEYLRGFQKRKNERKKIAREKNDKRVMEERKAIIRQFRDQQKSKSDQDSDIIPEIRHLVNPEVYDLPEHTVTIADFGGVDFVGNSGLRLGKNTGPVEDNVCDDAPKDSVENSTSGTANVSAKSLQQKLGACSNKLSSQKQKAKKSNRKQNLRAKLKGKKKGKKGRKTGGGR